MQPTPLLLSAEEGGRVSLTLVLASCRPLEVLPTGASRQPRRDGARGAER